MQGSSGKIQLEFRGLIIVVLFISRMQPISKTIEEIIIFVTFKSKLNNNKFDYKFIQMLIILFNDC